jgi:hypothetical protein
VSGPQIADAVPGPQGEPAFRDAVAAGPRRGPHDSMSDFLDSHFDAAAWDENVVHGYAESNSILLPAGLALGAAAIAPWDHSIAGHERSDSASVSDAGLAVLLAGTAAVGIFAPGEGRDGGEERWTMVEALALDLAATEVLKDAVRRKRPGSGTGTSFPSGHTSLAFCAATLIDRNSGHELGIPAYAIAAATAVSRVKSKRHFPSDVLAGAALGVLCGGLVDSLHFGGEANGHGISRNRGVNGDLGFDIGPEGGPVVALTVRF